MTNTTIAFPLRAEWKTLKPPGHHPDALDFMKVGRDGRELVTGNLLCYVFGGIAAPRFHGWSEPVLAPFDGVVVAAEDGWPDHTRVHLVGTVTSWFQATFLFRPKSVGTKLDIRPNVGNHVMIRSGSGVVAFLAHLRCGSVKVAAGQQVVTGETVGEVGNSGNSTAPHLHLNLFDQVDDLLRAKVLPLTFRRYEKRTPDNSWESVENGVPRPGEVIRSPARSPA